MSYGPAIRHLKRSDATMRRVIEQVGPCKLHQECVTDEFAALADSIIYQQLAYKAAATISRRFQGLYAGKNGDAPRFPTPAELLATPLRKLRSVGLSKQKARYMVDLARKAANGTVQFGHFAQLTDSEVVENVTLVKGIGRWTAEMFLIFCLRRPDVLPVGDLGVQYAFKSAYKMRKLPSTERMEKLAEPWRPYRTVATWYLWKSRRAEIGA